MSAIALPASTKITVFRNGDRNYFGKTVVINRRQMVDMEKLLDSITSDVGLPEAARYVCTPVGGTRVADVADLQPSKNYVVVGKGKFKRLPYLDLEASHSEWLRSCSKRRQRNIEQIEHKNNISSQEHRVVKCSRGGVTFFVYSSGFMYEPARRITLNEHILALKWKDICAEISQSLNAPFGAIKRLCTMDGVCVKNVQELKANEHYVAVGRFVAFQHLNYGATRKPFSVTANRQPRELESAWRLHAISEDEETSAESSEHSKTQHNSTTTRRRLVRRLPPVIYADGRTVFHTKPVSHKRKQSKQKPVDFNKEDDIFRAGARDETKDAEEVEELTLTETDQQPNDSTDKKQVEEEDLTAAEDDTTTDTVESHQLNGHKYVNNVEYGDDITESADGARDAHNSNTEATTEREPEDSANDHTEQSGEERGESSSRVEQVDVSDGTGQNTNSDEQQQNELLKERSDAGVGTDDHLSRTASIHINENGVESEDKQ